MQAAAIDINAAIVKLRTMVPGESFTYFTGYLARDCEHEDSCDARLLREAAYNLMKDGKISLTQRRLGPPVAIHSEVKIDWHHGAGPGFAYIATGR